MRFIKNVFFLAGLFILLVGCGEATTSDGSTTDDSGVTGLKVIALCEAVEVISSSLNVRTAPNTNDIPVATIQQGEQYVVVSREGNWANIWFDEQKRWVYTPTYTQSLNLPCGKVINTNTLNVRAGETASSDLVGTAVGDSLWIYVDNQHPDGSVVWKNIWYKSASRYVHGSYLEENSIGSGPNAIELIINSFSINAGATSTDTQFVTLSSDINNAILYYQVSEDAYFSDAQWRDYSSSIDFTLSSGDGLKTLYFRVKNSEGRLSEVVSATITLQTAATTTNRQINRDLFYSAYRTQFGPLDTTQVTGLNYLLANFEQDREAAFNNLSVWTQQIAYLLATTKHEVANTYTPITEYGNTYCANYDGGCTYKGRGYVQLTHKYNYSAMSGVTNVDLVTYPTRALEPDIAYTVMSYGSFHGIFTSRKLGDYIKVGLRDYYNARRVINGTDKASLIEGYAQKFETIMSGASQ